MSKRKRLLDKARLLPEGPGCYLMKKSEEVLYVGKAKNLKSRVSSYFHEGHKSVKTEKLVASIDSFDFILAKKESDALVLEANLIKEYSPKYNIRLKDDSAYPHIVIDTSEPFPRLNYVRRPKEKKKQIDIF